MNDLIYRDLRATRKRTWWTMPSTYTLEDTIAQQVDDNDDDLCSRTTEVNYFGIKRKLYFYAGKKRKKRKKKKNLGILLFNKYLSLL